MESINRNRPADAIQKQTELAAFIGQKQEAIASGRSFTKPSEAPSSWLEVSSLSRQSTIEQSWINNIGRARILAQQAESSLDSISNGVARARELMIFANNETLAQQDREVIAIEMEGLLEQFNQLTDARDSYGGKLFHSGDRIEMRIDTDVLVAPSPNLQAVSGVIDIGGGATDNLAQIMTDMIAAVRSGTPAERATQLDRTDSLTDHFSTLVANQGLMINRLDNQEERLQLSQLSWIERKSDLENIDVSEAISQFQSLLVNLEAAQRLYAQSSRSSLIQLIG